MARFCDHRLNYYLLSLLEGKREDKLAAVHVLIIVQQVSAKVEREAFADVETDSVAALILASAFLIFGLKVHLKQVLFIFLWNAHSLVSHTDVDPNKVLRVRHDELVNHDEDSVVLLTELDGVVHQINQNLLGPILVNHYLIVWLIVHALKL